MFTQKGSALIQALVAVAIISVMMSASMVAIETQSKESRALNQKMEALDLQRFLHTSLTDSSYCTALMTKNPLTFPTSIPKTLPLRTIPTSAEATAKNLLAVGEKVEGSRELFVAQDGVYLTDIELAAPNKYNATLKVVFDETHLVRQIQPVSLRMQFTIDPATNAVNGCTGGTVTAGGGGVTPGGKCKVIQRSFARGAPTTHSAGNAWSTMEIVCPTDFPVALSANVVPSAFAAQWATGFSSGADGYFAGGTCSLIFLRDNPGVTAAQANALQGTAGDIDKGLCAVTCCNL